MNHKKNCTGKRCGHPDMYYPQGSPSYPWMLQPMPPQMQPQPMPPQMQPQPMPPRPMPPQSMPPHSDGWMPWMGARGPMMPMDTPLKPMDEAYGGVWTMPQWSPQMWSPDQGDDVEDMRDREYFMQMYPGQTRLAQREVEHQCDLLDHEGSFMYDEYPDRIALARTCESVYQALIQNTDNTESSRSMSQIMEGDQNSFGGPSDEQVDRMQMGGKDRAFRDMIEVLLYHEMQKRRRKHRRRQGWYFG